MLPNLSLLDRRTPLQNARFGDVVALRVDVPMRYSELVAELRDGTTVRLSDKRQFLGHGGSEDRKAFYFRCHNGDIVRVRTNAARRRPIRAIEAWEEVALHRAYSASDDRIRGRQSDVHRIIAVDGSLCFAVPRIELSRSSILRALAPDANNPAMPEPA